MASEKFKKQLHQPWFGGGVGAALAALVGVGLLFLSFGKGLEDWSYDLPFLLREQKLVENIVVVSLDDESYRNLAQAPCEFDRSLHAQLLKRLQTEGAKLVAFDMLFIDTNRPITSADQQFAANMRSFNKVVIGGLHHTDYAGGSENISVFPPIDLFRDAARWGLVAIERESDFSARKHHPGTAQLPSLAWEAARVAGAEVTKHPETRGEPRWLNYYAPEPFRNFAYANVLSNNLPSDFSFRDKYVFVGSGEVAGYTGEEKEQFRYPWTWRSGHFPLGVEIHALTFSNLLLRDWMTRWPLTLEVLLIGFAGVSLGYGLSLFRPLPATGIALLLAIIVAALSFVLTVHFNVWFAWLIIIAVQVPLALGWSYLFHSIRAYMETKLLQSSLELYLSPKQVKQILKQPELLKPGAEQKTVSILFSDIAGFSKISERMDPEDLVKLLNNYYETAISCVHQTEGTVMNLIGDAILAIWNAPQEQPDHQKRACRAAILLHEQLVKFDAKQGSLPLRTRVGLHSGTVCVGNIGSSTHFNYTAIGESVNMASRLEGLHKQLGTNILATRDIQKAVDGQLVSRLIGHFRFKGFDQVVEVHELLGPLEIQGSTAGWRNAFAEGLHHFQRMAFEEAESCLRRTLEIRSNDGPSRFYLERIQELKCRPPSSEWTGEIDLREK